MTGWRIGWLLVPDELLDSVDRLAGNFTICPPALSQLAAVAAFEAYDELDANVARYADNRRRLLEQLPAIGLDRLAPADGAFYVYADVSRWTTDSVTFAQRLLADTGVALVPGVDFDPVDGGRFVRMCFAGDGAEIDHAVAAARRLAVRSARSARLTYAGIAMSHLTSDRRTAPPHPDAGHDHDHHDDDHDHDDHDDHRRDDHGLLDRVRHLLADVVGGHDHDTAEQTADALEADAAGRRALFISLAGLGATAILQAVVAVLSGSVALLGDTLHNAADALTAIPLLVAFALARRQPTKRYTYGYGRAEDLGGLFVVAMIALSSALAAYEAIDRLVHPRGVHHLWAVRRCRAGRLRRQRDRGAVPHPVSAAGSARRPWWPTGCMRAPTASPLSRCSSAPEAVALGWRWADPVMGLVSRVAILGVLRSAAARSARGCWTPSTPNWSTAPGRSCWAWTASGTSANCASAGSATPCAPRSTSPSTRT